MECQQNEAQVRGLAGTRGLQPRLDPARRRLVVQLGGAEEEFPWVWLRDSCQCRHCYEPLSDCRVVNLTEWDQSVAVVAAEAEAGLLRLTWEDGHTSEYRQRHIE